MTPDDVRKRVAEIAEIKGDPEAAHSSEDALWQDVLNFIAQDMPADAAELAREAVKTADLPFARWYA